MSVVIFNNNTAMWRLFEIIASNVTNIGRQRITLSLLKELLSLKIQRISIYQTSDLTFFCLGLRYRIRLCGDLRACIADGYGYLSRVTYMRG